MKVTSKNLIISLLLEHEKKVGKKQFGNPTGEYEYRVVGEALQEMGYVYPEIAKSNAL